MIISIDAKKAFYTIQHPFMIKKNPQQSGLKGESVVSQAESSMGSQ